MKDDVKNKPTVSPSRPLICSAARDEETRSDDCSKCGRYLEPDEANPCDDCFDSHEGYLTALEVAGLL